MIFKTVANDCSFWFYCTNNCLDQDDFGPAELDALEDIVESGSVEEVGILLSESSKLRINVSRKSVQLIDCTLTGVAANLPISADRFAAIQAYGATTYAGR